MDFWTENGGKLALKSEPKSILALKQKNQLNISPLMPNWVRRVQVGSKKRSKIDQNLKSKMGCLLASVFDGFWLFWEASWGGKWSQERTKIDLKTHRKNCEKSKHSEKKSEQKSKMRNVFSWFLE